MIARPKFEADNITRQGIDTVGREVMCSVADIDVMYGDLVPGRRWCGVVDGASWTVNVLR